MAYKAKTIQGAYDQFQRAALKRIEPISIFWGIHLDIKKDWEYFGHNKYGKDGERDAVLFDDMAIEKVLEDRGTPIPSNMKPVKSIIDQIENDTAGPLPYKRTYSEVEREHKIDESSSVVGWSMEVSQTYKVEASGEFMGIGGSASSETSMTAETHGEISEHHLRETEEKKTNTIEVGGDIPPHTIYYVEQQFDRGVTEVPVKQDIVIDLKFQVDDWKKFNHSKDHSLWGSSRRKSQRGSKTYSLLVIENSEDFLQLVTGVHPDYPNQRTNHLVENTPISKHIRWLLNPKNRAIRVALKLKYENSTSGHTRVIDHKDKEVQK